MPMIPAGVVETAERLEMSVTSAPAAGPDDPFTVLNPDGSVDARATTNKWANYISDVLGEPIDCKSPVFCTGLVILAGQRLNFRFGQVANFTGLPRAFCARVIRNLGYSHLIFKRELAGDLVADNPELDTTPLGTILFVLYCLTGTGQIQCDRDRRWRATPPEDVRFYEVVEVA